LSQSCPVIILCGGQGTRIRDVNENMPKVMLPIGQYPILWHIMRTYAHYGYKDFVLALGYRSWVIKEYFLNFRVMSCDFHLNLGHPQEIDVLARHQELDWNITFAETGEKTQTGRRVLLCEKYVEGDEFMVTYGDGVADIDVAALHAFHRDHGRVATVTGVRPPGRFGAIIADGDAVVEFSEKKPAAGGLINGGFFVFQRAMFDVLRPLGDTMLETAPTAELIATHNLRMYFHPGFWEPMDTAREYMALNAKWAEGRAPWKVWP